MTDVRFPAMRQQTMTALAALADRDYQQRVWIAREYPREGFYDDLTLNVNTLYDMVLPDPRSRLGVVLRNDTEVARLTDLEQLLGPLVDDLGDASDQQYLSDPRWNEVVAAAATALSAMKANE